MQTNSLNQKDKIHIWHPYTQMKTHPESIVINRGEGAYLIDINNKRYLDAISSWWVNLHGHANPYIAKKVSEQLYQLEHTIFAGFSNDKAIILAEKLIEIVPSNLKKVFYSDNGSTAVEVALKMAIQFYFNQGINKNSFIAFNDGYHGDTFGAMSVSGRGPFTAPFNSNLFHVDYIDPPISGNEEKSLAQLKALMKNSNKYAGFIFEPLVMGAGGMKIYSPQILDELIKIVHEQDIITIADEVMTGFYRTGKLFATEYLKNKPKIIALSKGITGGTMALGVTICEESIYNQFLSLDNSKTFFHGHSYTGNPIACSAAIASLELLFEPSCINNIEMIKNSHESFCNQIKNHNNATNVRSLGTILALDIKTNQNTSYFNSRRDEIYKFCIDRGVILRPLGNVIYVIPPYCITKNELEIIYQTIRELLSTYCFY